MGKTKYTKGDSVEAEIDIDPGIMEALYLQEPESKRGTLEEWVTNRVLTRLLCEPILTRNFEKLVLDSFLKPKDIQLVKKVNINAGCRMYYFKFIAPFDFSPLKNSVL